MQIGKGPPQAIGLGRHQNDMNMVWHQAIGPNLAPGPRSTLGQHIQIERIVGFFKKHLPAPVAPLGDKMRQSGNDKASNTSHA